MSTSTTTNKPALSLRDGSLKATIWANEMPKGGLRYSVEFSRSYTDEAGNWHDAPYFSNGEILRVAHLATKAYDAIAELRAKAKADSEQ